MSQAHGPGIVAPPGTPKPVVDKLNAAVNAGFATEAVQSKLKSLGASAMPGSPADYAAFLTTELPKWIAMAKLSGASTD